MKDPDVEQVQTQVEEQILAYYTEVDNLGEFIHPPSTDDELHEFIHLAFGFDIPRKVITTGHRAPFDFVSDNFFERVKNSLGFANRTGGKTLNVAILNFLDTFFKAECEVASAGAVLDQANKCYRYFTKFLELEWFETFCTRYREKTHKNFVRKAIQSWTEFADGSTLEVLTGTERGLRSPHPNKARIDEIDLIEWSVLQTGLSMAQSSGTIRGQNVFTSTRQKQRGSMQRMLDDAESKGIEIYEWNIWEALAKCTRRCIDDPEHGSCPIYTFCKGKAHHCAGFYVIDDFIDKVRVLDRETWETEWLNLRPSKHKLVYQTYDSTRHIMTPRKLYALTGEATPRIEWARVSGLDFGSSPGHPFVYIKLCQMPQGQWLLFHEYAAEQKLIRDHAAAIKNSPFYLPSEIIFADWNAQDRLELQNEGVRTKQAYKDVLMGIDYVKSLLAGFPPVEDPQLYIWYECQFVIDELGMYQWPTTAGGRVDRTGLPRKEYDHGLDATRYALYSLKSAPSMTYRTRSIVGI